MCLLFLFNKIVYKLKKENGGLLSLLFFVKVFV